MAELELDPSHTNCKPPCLSQLSLSSYIFFSVLKLQFDSTDLKLWTYRGPNPT